MGLPMTKIKGFPDSSSAVPGMAHFAGSGPAGKRCGDCACRGYLKESSRGHWSEELKQLVYNSYRVQKCGAFKRLTGKHGTDIDANNHACKYFEQKSK